MKCLRRENLLPFPEGKIDEQYPPTIHPFKSGAFRLAIENNIPIIRLSLKMPGKFYGMTVIN
ncbi:1-acyl-sn-glycerol-3-phosphate acyltransferase [Sphingobacterium sp. IITKGP-BTPF85]|uniref:1-acyl-sn-glycerol-3-phosphate acyltransferase n=1 Tax=Sphingobacterium sp. IITKGP-BTPF85 TaxID=1338009 RepID=UPI001E2F5F30